MFQINSTLSSVNQSVSQCQYVEMWTVQQKAQCVLWLAKFNSIVLVQREFRRTYNCRNAPDAKSIHRWFKQFKDTGSIEKQKSTGRPKVSEDIVERIRKSYDNNPNISISSRSIELGIPKSTVHRILHSQRLHRQDEPASFPSACASAEAEAL